MHEYQLPEGGQKPMPVPSAELVRQRVTSITFEQPGGQGIEHTYRVLRALPPGFIDN